jgi:hypothetical protein
MDIDFQSNTVKLKDMGVFEIDAYLDRRMDETTKDKAYYIRVKTGISTYYFPIE